MSIVALVFTAGAVYFSTTACLNSRSSVHFARAAALYAAHQREAGDAEMARGRKLRRRADRMLAPWRPAKGGRP